MPKRSSPPDPSIRAAVRARVDALGLNPFALARETGGAVSDDQVRRYLAGTTDLTSARLDAVLRVLGFAGWEWRD
jgi:hypothetical protein